MVVHRRTASFLPSNSSAISRKWCIGCPYSAYYFALPKYAGQRLRNALQYFDVVKKLLTHLASFSAQFICIYTVYVYIVCGPLYFIFHGSIAASCVVRRCSLFVLLFYLPGGGCPVLFHGTQISHEVYTMYSLMHSLDLCRFDIHFALGVPVLSTPLGRTP